jgi:nucleoside-diphosphate-sugar epimerase
MAVDTATTEGRTPPKFLNNIKVAMQNMLAAMQKFGVKRLVSLTGAGVEAPQDKPKFSNHLIKFALTYPHQAPMISN